MRCSDCKSRKYCDNANKVNYCAGYIFDDSKPKVQTNEEWLRQASTEQLAEFLNDCRFYFDGLKIVSAKYHDMKIEDIPLEWLKQPHSEVGK